MFFFSPGRIVSAQKLAASDAPESISAKEWDRYASVLAGTFIRLHDSAVKLSEIKMQLLPVILCALTKQRFHQQSSEVKRPPREDATLTLVGGVA